MSILPPNQPKIADKTPTKFFIWGPSMSGKTYLARQFPNPLILNTDGNGKKVETPSIDIRDFEHFMNVVGALEKENHTYETVIIDLIDDIETILEDYLCRENGVEKLRELKYGQGYGDKNVKWKNLMVRFANMKMNVIFISHFIEKSDDDKVNMTPSLPVKFLNMCMGRCDLGIKTAKIGNRYIKTVTERREAYAEDVVKDPIILEILKDVIGVFEKSATGNKPAGATPVGTKPITRNSNKDDVLPQNRAADQKQAGSTTGNTAGKPELKRVDINALGGNKELKKDTDIKGTNNITKDITEDKVDTKVQNAAENNVVDEAENKVQHSSLDELETLEDDLNNL